MKSFPFGVTSLLFVVCALQVSAFGQDAKYGQFAPPDAFLDGSPLAYYGSENEWSRRQFSQKKADQDYKRRGQRQLLAIIDDKPRRAIELAQIRLDADPNDLESLFCLAIAWTQLGQIDDAVTAMQRAIDGGLPVDRFLAGPRNLLQPLLETKAFQEIADKKPIRLIHGPMLGCVTENSAQVWVRTTEEELVTVRASATKKQGGITRTIVHESDATTKAAEDFTATVELVGLEPDTDYEYDVLIDGNSVLEGAKPRLRTSTLR